MDKRFCDKCNTEIDEMNDYKSIFIEEKERDSVILGSYTFHLCKQCSKEFDVSKIFRRY